MPCLCVCVSADCPLFIFSRETRRDRTSKRSERTEAGVGMLGCGARGAGGFGEWRMEEKKFCFECLEYKYLYSTCFGPMLQCRLV